MIEAILLMSLLGAIWWVPVAEDGQTLLDLLEQIANSTAAHFRWVWTRFLLNPLA